MVLGPGKDSLHHVVRGVVLRSVVLLPPHARSESASNRMLFFGALWALAGGGAIAASYALDAGTGFYAIAGVALALGLADIARGLGAAVDNR